MLKIITLIATRNIWRHPVRSLVLITAIVVGVWASIFTVATMNGMLQQRVSYLIDSEIAHVQVHSPTFLDSLRPSDVIPGHREIKQWLNTSPLIDSWSERIIVDGTLQTSVKFSGVRIRGIDPIREPQVTTLDKNIVEGRFFESGDLNVNTVLVGQSMAREHSLRVGHRIVLIFEDAHQELISSAFNIVGIYQSVSSDFEKNNIYVRNKDIASLLSIDNTYHEIAIRGDSFTDATLIAEKLSKHYPNVKVRSWRELSSELSTLIDLGGIMLYVVSSIIVASLAFGILNTMLMALFERFNELSVLLSLGMRRSAIFFLLIIESIILTFFGAGVGFLLSYFSIAYFSLRGVNFEIFAEGIAQLGWDHLIYPQITLSEYLLVLFIVMFMSLLASLYPAMKAYKLHPIKNLN